MLPSKRTVLYLMPLYVAFIADIIRQPNFYLFSMVSRNTTKVLQYRSNHTLIFEVPRPQSHPLLRKPVESAILYYKRDLQ